MKVYCPPDKIGLEMAMNYPDRVDKLFAFAATTKIADLRAIIERDSVFSTYIERAGKDYTRLSKTPAEYEAFVNQISQMWAAQPEYKAEQLAKIKARVAVSDGEYDETIRPERSVEVTKAIPGAKLVILPGVGHFAFLQDPQLFNRAVLGFLHRK
jgi:pimeloyl-ACP methyl ester carboxylesterase